MSEMYFYHTNSKHAVLSYSHYSDPAFDGHGATIFGDEKAQGLQWEYDDRLMQYDREKHEAAWEAAVIECGKRRTAHRIECYLKHYFDDPGLQIVAIKSGTGQFNGYAWYAYGFRPTPQEA